MKLLRKATVIPELPIKGLYPRLIGNIYRDGSNNGIPVDIFVAAPGQGLDDDDLVLTHYVVVDKRHRKITQTIK
jgi:hypothetical protein